MKFKVTKKEMRQSGRDILKIGYCNAQFLLRKFICKSKYKVVYYCEGFDWVEIGSANSKKEAIEIAKEFLKYNL